MKKYFNLVTVFVLFLVLPQAVLAQNTNRQEYSKIFDDYREKYDSYVIIHDKYELTYKQYLQYKTLLSQENLQKDLKDMLVSRDEVVIYYYKTIAAKLDDSSVTMSDERKSSCVQQLNDEANWFSDYKSNYKESDTLQTLSTESQNASLRFNGFSQNLYKCLYYIARGKVETFSLRYDGLYNDLTTLTDKIKNEQRDAYKLSDAKIDTINRWFGEIGLKTTAFENALAKPDVEIEKAQGKKSSGTYSNSIKLLNKAMPIFLDRLAKTKEITTEIKVSDD